MKHPDYYGGADNPYETIKVIRAQGWLEGFCKGNALKYLSRAGKKEDELSDMNKARNYINFWIEELEGANVQPRLFEVHDDDKDFEALIQGLVDEHEQEIMRDIGETAAREALFGKKRWGLVNELTGDPPIPFPPDPRWVFRPETAKIIQWPGCNAVGDEGE